MPHGAKSNPNWLISLPPFKHKHRYYLMNLLERRPEPLCESLPCLQWLLRVAAMAGPDVYIFRFVSPTVPPCMGGIGSKLKAPVSRLTRPLALEWPGLSASPRVGAPDWVMTGWQHQTPPFMLWVWDTQRAVERSWESSRSWGKMNYVNVNHWSIILPLAEQYCSFEQWVGSSVLCEGCCVGPETFPPFPSFFVSYSQMLYIKPPYDVTKNQSLTKTVHAYIFYVFRILLC